jgi:hypothetical protein
MPLALAVDAAGTDRSCLRSANSLGRITDKSARLSEASRALVAPGERPPPPVPSSGYSVANLEIETPTGRVERAVRRSRAAHCYTACRVRAPSALEDPGDDIDLFPEIVGDYCVPTRTRIEAQKASCDALVSAAAYNPLPDTRAVAGSRVPRQVARVKELMTFFRSLRSCLGRSEQQT